MSKKGEVQRPVFDYHRNWDEEFANYDEKKYRKEEDELWDTLEKTPTKKHLRKYVKVLGRMPRINADSTVFAYYSIAAKEEMEERYRTLTAVGQCEGHLVLRGSDIVVCCCKKMAELFAFRHAFHYRWTIYVPPMEEPFEEVGNVKYAVRNEPLAYRRYCPFCHARMMVYPAIEVDREEVTGE